MKYFKDSLLVSNAGSDSISIIDLEKDVKVAQVCIGDKHIGPHDIVRKDKNIIYSVNSYNNSIYKINLKKKQVEERVFVGKHPTHMQVVNGDIYVVNSDSNTVTIIDEDEFNVVGSISVGEKPHDIKADKNNTIYVTNHNGLSISTIDLEKNIESNISLDSNPFHLVMADKYMFILCHRLNGNTNSKIKVMNLDNKKIEKSIDIDGVIVDMVRMDKEDIIYVTNAHDGCLYKIDFNNEKILDKYKLGGMPNNIVYNKEKLYITDVLNNKIVVFNYKKKEIISRIDVGLEPSGIIF